MQGPCWEVGALGKAPSTPLLKCPLALACHRSWATGKVSISLPVRGRLGSNTRGEGLFEAEKYLKINKPRSRGPTRMLPPSAWCKRPARVAPAPRHGWSCILPACVGGRHLDVYNHLLEVSEAPSFGPQALDRCFLPELVIVSLYRQIHRSDLARPSHSCSREASGGSWRVLPGASSGRRCLLHK